MSDHQEIVFEGFRRDALGRSLLDEHCFDLGCAFGQPGRETRYAKNGTIGEKLRILADQTEVGACWLIDNGWGGPPGPVCVERTEKGWRNRGYWAGLDYSEKMRLGAPDRREK